MVAARLRDLIRSMFCLDPKVGGLGVSEFNPADVAVSGRRSLPEPFSAVPDDAAPGGPSRREREGLPSSYRMRADAHYVDQLTTRRADRPAAEALPRVPARGPERPAADRTAEARPAQIDRRSDQLLAELAEEIGTIESAVALLGGDASPMARRVSIDLIRAQTWRAGWLLRAHALITGQHRGRLQPRPLGPILSLVRDGFAAECRLSGVALHVRVPDWAASATVDEPALIAGLSGAVVWTLALVGQAEGVVITLTAEAEAGQVKSIEVSQDAVMTPGPADAVHQRPAPDDWTANLGASVARTVARQHRAEAAFLVGDRRHSTVRFTFS
jgi:hypothetical protein